MAGTNGFFEAESLFGTLTGWTPQDGVQRNFTKQVGIVLKASGDFLASQDYDEKEEISVPYKANASGVTIPSAGSILNGYHVDSVSVTFSQNDFVAMVVNGHKHTTGNPDSNCRVYAPTIGTVGGWGCPSSLGPFEVGEQAVGVRSMTYNLQVNHKDELDGVGHHFAGDNYDGTETLAVNLTGAGTFAGADGWHLDTNGLNKGNTGATTSSATYTKHLQGTYPSESQSSGSGS